MNALQYLRKIKNFEFHTDSHRCIRFNAKYIKRDKNTTHDTSSILIENAPLNIEPR